MTLRERDGLALRILPPVSRRLRGRYAGSGLADSLPADRAGEPA